MVIENDPSARMQVRSKGELMHPSACMVCGSGVCDDGYLDLGVFFDYEGTMYLCMACAYQAGETCGLFTPDEIKQTQDLAEKLATANEVLTQELKDANERLAAFNTLLNAFGGNSASDVASEAGTKGEPVPDSSPSPFIDGPDDGEPVAKESVTVSRRRDTGKSQSRDVAFD